MMCLSFLPQSWPSRNLLQDLEFIPECQALHFFLSQSCFSYVSQSLLSYRLPSAHASSSPSQVISQYQVAKLGLITPHVIPDRSRGLPHPPNPGLSCPASALSPDLSPRFLVGFLIFPSVVKSQLERINNNKCSCLLLPWLDGTCRHVLCVSGRSV